MDGRCSSNELSDVNLDAIVMIFFFFSFRRQLVSDTACCVFALRVPAVTFTSLQHILDSFSIVKRILASVVADLICPLRFSAQLPG